MKAQTMYLSGNLPTKIIKTTFCKYEAHLKQSEAVETRREQPTVTIEINGGDIESRQRCGSIELLFTGLRQMGGGYSISVAIIRTQSQLNCSNVVIIECQHSG